MWVFPRWQTGDRVEAASDPAWRSVGADLATLLEAAEHTAPTAYRFQPAAALSERTDEELLQGAGPDDQACLSAGWGNPRKPPVVGVVATRVIVQAMAAASPLPECGYP